MNTTSISSSLQKTCRGFFKAIYRKETTLTCRACVYLCAGARSRRDIQPSAAVRPQITIFVNIELRRLKSNFSNLTSHPCMSSFKSEVVMCIQTHIWASARHCYAPQKIRGWQCREATKPCAISLSKNHKHRYISSQTMVSLVQPKNKVWCVVHVFWEPLLTSEA